MDESRADSQPIVCIFGSYSPRPQDPLYEQAYAIGRALAEAGFVVCNGGYHGTMEASAKGAKDAGGSTIGVTCTVFSNDRDPPLKANPYIDREMQHTDLLQRIEAMMRMSAAYIILDGGTGTLAEFGIVWEYVCKGFIEPRPIFVWGEFWRPVVDRILSVRPKSGRHLHCVQSVEEILSVVADGGIPAGG